MSHLEHWLGVVKGWRNTGRSVGETLATLPHLCSASLTSVTEGLEVVSSLQESQFETEAAFAAVREYRPSTSFARLLAIEGIQPFSMYQLRPGIESAAYFRLLVQAACSSHGALGACLHLCKPTEYAAMRLLLDAEGTAGFALDGQDLVSVFCHKDRRKRHATRTMVPLAVELGGIFLNAFDTFLPHLYGQSGFKTVARLSWDDGQAPPGWDYEATRPFNRGRPDVVFMIHTDLVPLTRRVDSFASGRHCQRQAVGASFVEVTP